MEIHTWAGNKRPIQTPNNRKFTNKTATKPRQLTNAFNKQFTNTIKHTSYSTNEVINKIS